MPDWRTLHEAACRENDRPTLEKLVYETEEAIYDRMQEVAHRDGASLEMQQLKIAMNELLAIKTEKLGWPHPFPNTLRK